MQKKVIFFLTSLQSGGAENYLIRFISERHIDFEDITVFCKSGFGGQLETQYKSIPNVRIIKRKIGYLNPLHYLYIFKLFKKNRYDSVCDFSGNFSGLILRIAQTCNIPTRIVFYRNSGDRFQKSKIKNIYNRWVKNLVIRSATGILANSKAAFNYYFPDAWMTDARFEVVYNGINASTFTSEKDNLRLEFGMPEHAFVVGHTGRYNYAKNHSTILKVAEELINSNKDFYFILCGNGVRKNLESYVRDRNLEKRILLFENRNDVPKFLNTMNCYYFPSFTEGQPNALIEAMLMGIPTIASDIEPIKETVPKELFPYLVAPKDINTAKELIMKIYKGELVFNYQKWAMDQYDSKKLFEQFFKRL